MLRDPLPQRHNPERICITYSAIDKGTLRSLQNHLGRRRSGLPYFHVDDIDPLCRHGIGPRHNIHCMKGLNGTALGYREHFSFPFCSAVDLCHIFTVAGWHRV
jgi:hypothetical protein